MGLIGSGMGLLAVTYPEPPAEHPVSRIARPDVLLSLVRAPALPPQHADFGSQFHTPSNRCLRFGPRVAATPARLAPVLPARLWTDQTFTGKLIPAFLSHPASGSDLEWVTAKRTAGQGRRIFACGNQSAARLVMCRSFSSCWPRRRSVRLESVKSPGAGRPSRSQRQRSNDCPEVATACRGVDWRAMADEDGHYSFAVAL